MTREAQKYSLSVEERIVSVTVFLAVASLFIWVDVRAGNIPTVLQWVVFLPLRLVQRLNAMLPLKDDFELLLSILLGVPLLLMYWFYLYTSVESFLRYLARDASQSSKH
ncbi:MAG: hypothetical protein HY420_03275 [Candidatus Kerfeldbacteria bacterium]|nr:hypothetical protein [Candidatus Kerfeldbacteria bacterium]